LYVTIQWSRSTIAPDGGAGDAVTDNVGTFGHTVTEAEAVAVWPVDDVAVAVHVETPTSACVGVIAVFADGTARLPLRVILPVQA
jgi:hypothetical protein